MDKNWWQHWACGWPVTLVALLILLMWPGAAHGREVAPDLGASVEDLESPGQAFHLFLPTVGRYRRPSSFTLIEQALQRGEIDRETALVYRVFATFGDERLPEPLRGDNTGIIDADAVTEAKLHYATLSPATRTILVPFLIPPIYRGSWYDRQVNGAAAAPLIAPEDDPPPIEDMCQEIAAGLFLPLESAHFVVWYPPGDSALWNRANAISAILELRVYPILTDLFREPKSDAGLGCNPGDGRLDIYLLRDQTPSDDKAIAVVSAYQDCRDDASYMTILQGSPDEAAILAHEFMHMIQNTYNPTADCIGFDSWWIEGTAHWAIDYFEEMDPQPDSNLEQDYARAYLKTTDQFFTFDGDNREYGAYLWPFYLTRYEGYYNPDLIARIYQELERPGNPGLKATIDAQIPGGWAERWPEFAWYNLNLAPHNYYEQWDGLPLHWSQWASPSVTGTLGLDGAPRQAYNWRGEYPGNQTLPLYSLTMRYLGFGLADDVRLFAFKNTFLGLPHVRVQAFLRIQGRGWQGPVDWSDQQWAVFCRDLPDERVTEVVLIASQSDWTTPYVTQWSNGLPRIVLSNLGCAGWQGSANWQIQGRSWDSESEANYTIRGNATPQFALTRRALTGDVIQFEYQPTSGQATWSTTLTGHNFVSGQIVQCTRNGGQVLTPDMGGLLVIEDLGTGQLDRRFYGAGLVPAVGQCPGLGPWSQVPWLQTDLSDSDLRPWLGTGGDRLQGSDVLAASGADFSHTTISAWNLTALSSSRQAIAP